MNSWLTKWNPEDEQFWKQTGSKIAWSTLIITTLCLILSFTSWFIMSVVVVKLPGLGFSYNRDELFWLSAIPGLAAGLFRVIHTFLLPMVGTRHILTFATLLKLIPVVGIGLAVMNPATPFWLFMLLAFTTGFGGGDFSSFMASTSLFFPKRLKGTALGIQAGIGNFGVSIIQFISPILLSVALYGGPSIFTSIDAKELAVTLEKTSIEKQKSVFASLDSAVQKILLSKAETKTEQSGADIFVALPVEERAKAFALISPKEAERVIDQLDAGSKAVTNKNMYLQSVALWHVPFLLLFALFSWTRLRSIPMKSSIKEQADIFSNKHTWFCTISYLMTFGTFSGLSAAFPLLTKVLYGNFPNPQDPLTYAFYGPLIGSASRVLFGFVADKIGGAILTTISGLGILLGSILLFSQGLIAPSGMDQFPMFVGVMMGIFFFTGIGNAGTFRQFPIIFSDNPRRAAGVIGWTSAVASFGPFIFSFLIGKNISRTGNPNIFFIGLICFSAIAIGINWYYYTRKGCEKPS